MNRLDEIYETMRLAEACKRRRDVAKRNEENWTRDHTDYCRHLEVFYLLVKKELR